MGWCVVPVSLGEGREGEHDSGGGAGGRNLSFRREIEKGNPRP